MQLLRRGRIFGVHVHHKMRICGEKRHLALRIAPVGAMRIGLDEFPDSEAIRGFFRGDRSVFAHVSSPCSICLDTARDYSRMALGSRYASIPNVPNSRSTPECLNPPNGACWSSSKPLFATR